MIRLPLILAALATASATAHARPRWATDITPPARSAAGDAELSYRLVTYQLRHTTRGWQTHERFTVDLRSAEEVARWPSLEFAPGSFELDFVRVTHDGRTRDLLKGHPPAVADDGTRSVSLGGIEAGDTLDYAFSYAYEGVPTSDVISGQLPLAWGVPCDRRVIRILVPRRRTLEIKIRGGFEADLPVEVTSRRRGAYVEYVYEATDVPAIAREDGTPAGTLSQPVLEYSELRSWNALSERLAPAYAIGAPPPPLIRQARSIAGSFDTPMARAVGLTRWVQREIAPQRSPNGPWSPRPPKEVLANRGGTAFEHARLLVAMLRAVDIDAEVALASAASREGIVFAAARPELFDVALVGFTIDGTRHWVDPSAQFDRGDRPTVPAYGELLTVSTEHPGLVDMPEPALRDPQLEVSERYRPDRGDAYLLRVEDVYRGWEATKLRQRLATEHDAVVTEYFDYYQQRDHITETIEPLTASDDQRANAITLAATYRLPRLWTDGRRGFLPNDVFQYVTSLEDPDRRTPLALRHPVVVRQRIRVDVARSFRAEHELEVARNDYFVLHYEATPTANGVELEWTYRSRAPLVPPEDFERYQRNLREADSISGYRITIDDAPADGDSDRYWVKLVAILIGFVVLGGGGQLLANRRPLPGAPR